MRKFLFLALFSLTALNCTSFRAYHNTFYLAEKSFQTAQEARLKSKETTKLNPAVKRLYEEAITKCSRVLTFYSGSKYVDDALLMIGKSYYYMEEYPKAERKFQEIIAGFPRSNLLTEANYFLGSAYFQMGLYTEAASAWQDILNNPKQKKFHRQALFSLAALRFKREEYDTAIQLYRQYLSQYKKDAQAVLAQGQIAEGYWLKKEYENAWKAYAEMKNFTDDKEIIYRAEFKAGQTAYLLERAPEGMAIFKRLEANPDYYKHLPEIKLQLAVGLLKSGRTEEASQLNRKIITDYPKSLHSAQAYYQEGILYQDYKEDLKTAKENFDKVKDESPKSEYAPLALQKSADISKLEEYRKQLSEGESAKNVETEFLLAEFYLTHMQKPDSALATYKNIVRENPQSEFAPKSLLALAYICGNLLSDTAGCRQACEELIRSYPSTDYAAEAYRLLNQEPGITDSLTAALLFRQAEELLFEGHNPDSATKVYQIILDNYPNSVYLPKAMLGQAYILENYSGADTTADSGWVDSTVYLAYYSILEKFPDSEAASVAKLKLGLKEKLKPKVEVVPPKTAPDTITIVHDTAAIAETDTVDTLVLGLPRAPDPISKGEFVYPPELIEKQISGYVELRIDIDYFTGEVRKIEIGKSIGNDEIDRRVLEALRVARFDTKRLYPSYFEGIYGYRFKVQAPLPSSGQ